MASAMSFREWVHARRISLGMTQRELAERAGMTPGNISAIESGKRVTGDDVRQRLTRALTELPSVVLDRNRAVVLDLARRHGISNVRVFGSVARGTDRVDSDIDLLVAPPAKDVASHLVDFHDEVEERLATQVDVMTDHDGPEGRALANARKEALAL